ncbi:uncharacterized protein LOC144573011 [Carex rostrata]
MGIWDYVSSATDTISGGVTRSREIVGGAAGKVCAAAPDLSGALKNTPDLTKVASETAVWTSQAVVERMPDREGWQRIGRLGLRIADYAIDQGSKPFTGNIPVYRFVKEELSKNKSHEQPLKEKMDNTELAKLKATIQNLEKKNMELEELRQRMENLEKKLVVINQNGINQKGDKRPKLMEWCPPEPIDLI